jgi:hypothetical protein
LNKHKYALTVRWEDFMNRQALIRNSIYSVLRYRAAECAQSPAKNMPVAAISKGLMSERV